MIYICIPTHNEQQTVGVVLWKLRQVLTDFPREYQLLVADDASTDKTPEVLEPYTRVLPLTVIRSDSRQGSAASLELLLREAVRRSEYPKRDVIVTLQADFSEEPDDLVPLAKRLEAGADVAVGNKVSVSKATRVRRFARSLARFFMRRQKWPEGVMTPFDGYRAYRLYAIKRAIEDRRGSRLIRYDGWAGNAELLRAVMPHARRVDVVDIHDRPDRLQRPHREKPFAAAMQVRVMAAGTEPEKLAGVEELDRIARTASRSRERPAITPQTIQAGRSSAGAARTNGSRRQGQNARRDEGRSRAQANGTARVSAESGGARQGRTRPQPAEGRSRQKGEEGRSGRQRAKQTEGRRRPARKEQDATAVAPEEGAPPVDVSVAGGPALETQPPKRKRRRRKRGGQASPAAGQQDQDQEQDQQQDDLPSGESLRLPDTGPNAGGQAPAGQAAAGQNTAGQNTAGQVAAGQTAAGQTAAGQTAAGQTAAGQTAAGQVRDAAGEAAEDRPAARAEKTAAAGAAGEKKRRRRGGRRGGRGRRKPRTADAERSVGDADVSGSGAGSDAPRQVGGTAPGEIGGGAPRDAGAADESAGRAERPIPEPAARTEND